MFQFGRFPAHTYFIQHALAGYCPAGFPHSDICGSSRMCRSPQLFAACHVLRRLLMPRHSPCALFSLIFWFSVFRIMQALQKFLFNCCVTLFFLVPHFFRFSVALLFFFRLYSVFKVQPGFLLALQSLTTDIYTNLPLMQISIVNC